eukprot:TRINITY_DN41880_c0_g1_i1.p1 TRINITY_DN41880_c0_g1~~TRINITY_DN41880_c0_g1_i1.p1  ORF type:complete len:205 (-),score=11.35 TRINITY_DN41880_c0_g1_i1:81-695(-)
MLDDDDNVQAKLEDPSSSGAYLRAVAFHYNTFGHYALEVSICSSTECQAFPLGLRRGETPEVGYTNSKDHTRHVFTDILMVKELKEHPDGPLISYITEPVEVDLGDVKKLTQYIGRHNSGWKYQLHGSLAFAQKFVQQLPIDAGVVCDETPTENSVYEDHAYNCASWVLAITNCLLRGVYNSGFPELRMRSLNFALTPEWVHSV